MHSARQFGVGTFLADDFSSSLVSPLFCEDVSGMVKSPVGFQCSAALGFTRLIGSTNENKVSYWDYEEDAIKPFRL